MAVWNRQRDGHDLDQLVHHRSFGVDDPDRLSSCIIEVIGAD